MTPKETNNNKEFYVMKFADYHNETIKQIAVRIETLVRKAYSLNTHDYKNTKMTEILNDDLNTTIKENSNKKESIPSLLQFENLDLDFRKTSRQIRTSRNHDEN